MLERMELDIWIVEHVIRNFYCKKNYIGHVVDVIAYDALHV